MTLSVGDEEGAQVHRFLSISLSIPTYIPTYLSTVALSKALNQLYHST